MSVLSSPDEISNREFHRYLLRSSGDAQLVIIPSLEIVQSIRGIRTIREWNLKCQSTMVNGKNDLTFLIWVRGNCAGNSKLCIVDIIVLAKYSTQLEIINFQALEAFITLSVFLWTWKFYWFGSNSLSFYRKNTLFDWWNFPWSDDIHFNFLSESVKVWQLVMRFYLFPRGSIAYIPFRLIPFFRNW